MKRMEFIPALFATLLVCFTSNFVVQGQHRACTHGDVRLVRGRTFHQGLVEFCSNGVWGTICAHGWRRTDAGVVCRQLGYAFEGATTVTWFGYVFGSTHLTNVSCTGNETRLIDCSYSTDTSDILNYCSSGGMNFGDAGVDCQRGNKSDSVVEYNITAAVDTDIEAIRLINGQHNDVNSGRLELLYNGVWGTVCDRFWSYSDAKVACRMIGFDDAACAITSNYFGQANSSVRIWMDNVQCTGSEEVLDNCSFSGWGVHASCSHSINDAGIVCVNISDIGIPYDIQLVESSSTTLNISWMVVLPSLLEVSRYYFLYTAVGSSSIEREYFRPESSVGGTDMRLSHALTSLTRDTEYRLIIRAEIRYSPCNNFVYGRFSDVVSFRTNATRKQSTLPIRLIPPYPELDFLGRIEVFYNDTWGTICDDYFSITDGNVVCEMLNFTQGALCVPSSYNSFAQGTGPIWLDDVGCTATDEVLEDCTHNGWGIHNCDHGDDVGVVCRHTLPPVKNLTVIHVAHSSVTLSWNQYSFPRGVRYSSFSLLFRNVGRRFSSGASVSGHQTVYTRRNLDFQQTYNISIRARASFRYCSSSLIGEYSDEISITTEETAPDGPPTSFHLVVINNTAIEASWELPEINLRNGFIRGYKLFVQSRGRDIRNITITNNQTLAYIVGGLERATQYTFSILAYTVADGPRSIYLTAVTLSHDPLIIGFGINGDGIDKVLKQTYQYGIQVHCTVIDDPSITSTDWFFANGSKVGLVDTNFREGHYNNGTTVLQIGIDRYLRYCDGGNYTCVVNTTSGRTEKRSFHLLINSYPPRPSRPSAFEIKSTSITIDWLESACDGGHIPKAFNIRYRSLNSPYISPNTYTFVTVLDDSQRRHRVTGLSPSTLYEFSVQVLTFDSRTSSYSLTSNFTTLPSAPSAPRDVIVRLIAPFLVEISWRTPALPNGVITHYTVYAIPQISHEDTRSKRQTPTLPKTIKKAFPSTSRAGNISLTTHSITYQFQVSASVTYDLTSYEGELSPFSPNSSVYVPKPGLPKPANVSMISVTNTSITLGWEYPPPPIEAIEKFLVAYIGEVYWRSPNYDLVQFEDSGETSVTDTTITVFPLVPGTNYAIRVSAVTQSGRGAEATHYERTRASVDEKLAFFQLRMSPVLSCLDFVDPSNNVTYKLLEVRRAIIKELNVRVSPSCGLTTANIRDDEFSCHGGLTNRIVYRAMIIGTDTCSAPDLVSLIQSWVASGSASVSVFSTRLRFDKDCNTYLDTFNEPDCPPHIESQQETTATMPKENVSPAPSALAKNYVRAGEISGILIGAIIIVLLAVLTLVITVMALRKYKCKTHKSLMQHDQMFDASFSDIGSAKESINMDVDSKEN